jgi:hypothetical protein
MLERYFKTKYMEQNKYTRLGGYWDRKGETEIDLLAIDEINNKANIIEIKRNADKINLSTLTSKFDAFEKATGELKGFEIRITGLSMNDM